MTKEKEYLVVGTDKYGKAWWYFEFANSRQDVVLKCKSVNFNPLYIFTKSEMNNSSVTGSYFMD